MSGRFTSSLPAPKRATLSMISSASPHVAQAPLGANRLPGGEWEFVLWAPNVRRASIHLLGSNEHIIDMDRDDRGYHFAVIEPIQPGARYLYRLDGGRELPDPASRFQPEGPMVLQSLWICTHFSGRMRAGPA